MFFYDVFWVFISPHFFTTQPAHGHSAKGVSVMINVAQGGDTGEAFPMLLRMPVMNDQFEGENFLGFGDVILPGLVVSYLLRQDKLGQRGLAGGYFLPAVLGYVAGLSGTM